MNGAAILVEMLKHYHVRVVFGVPGDTSIPLYEALYDQRSHIRHVLARDERSAAFMADVYARLTHKPGVCECPSGAGPLYAVPGVAEANASSIPVLCLTSDIPMLGEGKQTITELDTQNLFASVTKWSSVLKDVSKIPETIRRAFRIATSGRPGAIHLAFPMEVMKSEVRHPGPLYSEPDCHDYPAYRTRGSRKVLEQLADTLSQAQRPACIAGGGVNHSRAEGALSAVAEWLCAPVLTTISGQGVMPDEHPLALGVVGDNGYHPHAHQAVQEADTLLYVGCKMGSVSTISWTMPAPDAEQKILQIDLNPEFLGNNYHNHLSVAGDARLVLEDLLVLLKGRTAQRQPAAWLETLNASRKAFWTAAKSRLESNTTPIKPPRLVAALNPYLNTQSIVIADAGTPTPYITRYLKLGGNGSRFIIPRSYGGLGYAIPGVVGAHCARPEARLVALFGDGSLGMSAGELETLARLAIPCVLIHCNNASFGWIKALQHLHSQGKYLSVDFTPGDPCSVARGFGLKALQVKTPTELEAALDEAFRAEAPVFVDVHTEPEVDDLPPVYSWHHQP